MNHAQLTLCTTTSALAALMACAGQPTNGSDAPSLAGRYQSACLPQPQADGTTQYARLDFDLSPDTWTLDYQLHGDAACTARLVGVRIEGPYEVGGPAPGLEDTFQARFGFAKKTITPYVDGLVGALAAMGCGSSAWQLGQPQDVLEAGCAAFGQYPVSRCAADYDLVKLDAEGLHFGARPADNDMCTPEKRPTRLNPSVFQRR
jgi:hypothetical protein